MNPDGKFQRIDKFKRRRIADETFLIPVIGHTDEMEKIFILNDMADFIWQQLDGKRTLGQIRETLVQKFQVKKSDAWNDIIDLVSQLLNARLIEGIS